MGRDFTKQLSAAELEELVAEFRLMPTYENKNGKESISSSDLATLYNRIGYPSTPELLAGYKGYWDTHFNGIMTLEEYRKTFQNMHNTAALAKVRVAAYDLDGDGFISLDEFEEYMKLLRIHDPYLQGLSFEDFVRSADTNQDGKVSVEEFGEWIANSLPK